MRPNLYDYLKVFAIICMIIDHVGYFLYPDNMELRMIGRLAFPVFFMLIGRNQSPKIAPSLIIAATLIQGSLRGVSLIKGYDLWELSILPAAILVKLIMNRVSNIPQYIRNRTGLWLGILSIILLICTLSAPYGKDIIDYGSMTLGMAILGRIIKLYYKQGIVLLAPICIGILGLFLANTQFMRFNFNQRSFVFAGWIIGILCIRAMSFSNRSLRIGSAPSQRNRRDQIILYCSTYAVWIYVIHFLILLGIVAV